jgi:hypothetical protein
MKISENTAFYLLSWCAVLLLGSCTSDQLPEPIMADCETDTPTYTLEVKPIIDETCAYSGCHLDSAPGRFDDYDGLLPFLHDNTFRQRVLIQRSDPTTGMPPNFAPGSRPINLTPEQLTIIECWLNAGFPE